MAPYLIVVFRLDYEPARLADGTERRRKNYYVRIRKRSAQGATMVPFAGFTRKRL